MVLAIFIFASVIFTILWIEEVEKRKRAEGEIEGYKKRAEELFSKVNKLEDKVTYLEGTLKKIKANNGCTPQQAEIEALKEKYTDLLKEAYDNLRFNYFRLYNRNYNGEFKDNAKAQKETDEKLKEMRAKLDMLEDEFHFHLYL